MVEKHEKIADFELLHYSEKMLRECWDKQIDNFETLVKTGWTDRSILDFINWLGKTSYASSLFPGSSLGTLLISKPKNGKLNYQQTLRIQFDRNTNLFNMEYTDHDLINDKDDRKKAIQWNLSCSGLELSARFLEFLDWNINWK